MHGKWSDGMTGVVLTLRTSPTPAPTGKPASRPQTIQADQHREKFDVAQTQAAKDPVGTRLLGRKNNIVGYGKKRLEWQQKSSN